MRKNTNDSTILETKKWTYEGNNIASVTTDDESYDVYAVMPGAIGNVLERHTVNTSTDLTSASRYYQYNHRGDVIMVTDSSGDLIWAQDYTAFGDIATDDHGDDGDSGVKDDLLITGKDWDVELGLYYFNARWYDPETGRFITETPLQPWVEGAYVYCNNDPIGWVDNNGLVSDRVPQIIKDATELRKEHKQAYDTLARTYGPLAKRYNMTEEEWVSVQINRIKVRYGIPQDVPIIQEYGNSALVAGSGALCMGAGVEASKYANRLIGSAMVIGGGIATVLGLIDVIKAIPYAKHTKFLPGLRYEEIYANGITPTSPPRAPEAINLPSVISPIPFITIPLPGGGATIIPTPR